jgi:hypothetical protein
LVLLLSAGLLASPAACDDSTSSSSGPQGSGDKLIVDVDATMQASQPPANVSGEGGIGYVTMGDGGYAPLAWCQQCGCEGGTYCFGGGTGFTTFSGACSPPSGSMGIGCNAPPAACDASDCVCIIQALGLTCVAECLGTENVAVYCPTP